MKGLLYFLFFAAVGAGIYLYFQKPEYFQVKDRIVVSQPSGMDINGPITAPPKHAVIRGTITNISEKNFYDIEIYYQAGRDTVTAVVGSLASGQSAEFETSSMRSRTGRPDYELVHIAFSEE